MSRINLYTRGYLVEESRKNRESVSVYKQQGKGCRISHAQNIFRGVLNDNGCVAEWRVEGENSLEISPDYKNWAKPFIPVLPLIHFEWVI